MHAAPLRYELKINGETVAITGVGEYGVLSGSVHWVRRNPTCITSAMRSREHFDESDFLQESCEVSLTGLDSVTDKHVDWGTRPLKPGDVVSIRILGPGNFDPPKDYRNSQQIEEAAQEEREIFEESRKIYFDLKSKYEPEA